MKRVAAAALLLCCLSPLTGCYVLKQLFWPDRPSAPISEVSDCNGSACQDILLHSAPPPCDPNNPSLCIPQRMEFLNQGSKSIQMTFRLGYIGGCYNPETHIIGPGKNFGFVAIVCPPYSANYIDSARETGRSGGPSDTFPRNGSANDASLVPSKLSALEILPPYVTALSISSPTLHLGGSITATLDIAPRPGVQTPTNVQIRVVSSIGNALDVISTPSTVTFPVNTQEMKISVYGIAGSAPSGTYKLVAFTQASTLSIPINIQ